MASVGFPGPEGRRRRPEGRRKNLGNQKKNSVHITPTVPVWQICWRRQLTFRMDCPVEWAAPIATTAMCQALQSGTPQHSRNDTTASHQRQTTQPVMLYQRFLNQWMDCQMCQHSQTVLNIKPVSQRRPRGGSDTRVTTALPTTVEGLEPKHA